MSISIAEQTVEIELEGPPEELSQMICVCVCVCVCVRARVCVLYGRVTD